VGSKQRQRNHDDAGRLFSGLPRKLRRTMFTSYTLVTLKPGLAVNEFAHLNGRTFLFFGIVNGSEETAVLVDSNKLTFMEYLPLSMLEAI
jgi:hypothetical protein